MNDFKIANEEAIKNLNREYRKIKMLTPYTQKKVKCATIETNKKDESTILYDFRTLTHLLQAEQDIIVKYKVVNKNYEQIFQNAINLSMTNNRKIKTLLDYINFPFAFSRTSTLNQIPQGNFSNQIITINSEIIKTSNELKKLCDEKCNKQLNSILCNQVEIMTLLLSVLFV